MFRWFWGKCIYTSNRVLGGSPELSIVNRQWFKSYPKLKRLEWGECSHYDWAWTVAPYRIPQTHIGKLKSTASAPGPCLAPPSRGLRLERASSTMSPHPTTITLAPRQVVGREEEKNRESVRNYFEPTYIFPPSHHCRQHHTHDKNNVTRGLKIYFLPMDFIQKRHTRNIKYQICKLKRTRLPETSS